MTVIILLPPAAFGGGRWHEFDPVYPVIRLLNWLGAIKLKELSLKRVEVEF